MPRKPATPQPRQRGTIVPEGDGKWRVRIFTGYDNDGKRQYASELVCGTFSQADKHRTSMADKLDTNSLAKPTKETVGQFVERFLTNVKKDSVLAATYRGYEIQLRTHIAPALGGIKLKDLTTFRVQQWIATLVEKGLSYSSIRHAYVVLDMALTQAVEWNQLGVNPATKATLPTKLKANKAEMKTFDANQMHRFLVGIPTARAQYRAYSLLFHLLLTCGLRPSEACALRWSDFDLDRRSLTVKRALTQVTSGTWEVKNIPKTAKGRRTLRYPRAVAELLAPHKAKQNEARLSAGAEWVDDGFVFTTRTGHHLMLNNLSRAWKALCKHAGVPAIRMYDARHTAATLELMAGVDPKTVSQRRGHASVAFTMDTYAHVLDAMDEGAADAMDDMLDRASQPPRLEVING